MSNANLPKVFVTIDKLLYRESVLFQLLQQDIDIVGECSTGVETLQQLNSSQATVLIIEETLSDNDGLTISEIALAKNPRLAVILLVENKINQNRLSIYLDSGIKSVLSKTQSIRDLIKTLYYAQSGQVYINAEQFHDSSDHESLNKSNFLELSDREQEVATLIGRKIPIKDIAENLGVSSKTVHTYKERILIKMGFERLPELILFMQRYIRQVGL
ncbi:MAG: response regulator transcription factor [Gammaproteobacteria bacterium]|nr:response regulator transcription factor [Gammaproteobacteria bacterium]